MANALSNGYHAPKIMEYHGNYDEDRPISSIAVTRDSSKLLSESRDDDLGVVVHDISTYELLISNSVSMLNFTAYHPAAAMSSTTY